MTKTSLYTLVILLQMSSAMSYHDGVPENLTAFLSTSCSAGEACKVLIVSIAASNNMTSSGGLERNITCERLLTLNKLYFI